MRYVMVQNDGEIDPRLIELMGASTKDGVSSIGMFGTGWKYGIALALRKNIPIHIFSGKKHIEFTKKTESIGEGSFDRICYRVGKSGLKRTSLTTSMGSKDWTDDWFLFREIVSNAIDCGGVIISKTDPVVLEGVDGTTRVFIGSTDRLDEVVSNIDCYVRRSGEKEATPFGKIFSSISGNCRIYKKGILVRELDSPGVFDYELNDIALSESRTSDTWTIYWEMRRLLSSVSKESLRKVLREQNNAERDCRKLAEANIVFSSYDKGGDSSWAEAFKEEFGDSGVLCAKTPIISDSITSLGKTPVSLPQAVADVLRGVSGIHTDTSVLGAGISAGLTYRAPTTYENIVLQKVLDIIGKIFGNISERITLRVFSDVGSSSTQRARLFREDSGNYTIALFEGLLSEGLRSAVSSVLREIHSGIVGSGVIVKEDRDGIEKSFVENLLPSLGFVV